MTPIDRSSGPSPNPPTDAESLRRLYRSHVTPSDECPQPEALAALVLAGTGEEPPLADEVRRRLIDHLVRCTKCAANYRDLAELHSEAGGGAAPTWRRSWLAAAAALLVALGLALFLWLPGDSPETPDTLRSTSATGSVSPPEGAVLGRLPSRFTWPSQPGASSYRLRLYDEDAELLWESEPTDGTGIDLPADLEIGSGKRFFWTVEVEGDVPRSQLGPFWVSMSS